MNTRVLLIRHATTPKVGKGLTGWLPGVSLDDNGRAQAQKLVKQLEAVPLDAIYSSPLERTRETAAPLATSRGIEVIENQDLGEIHFGEWQGKEYHIQDDFAPYFFEKWSKLKPAQLADEVLADTSLWGADLNAIPGFAQAVKENMAALLETGVSKTIQIHQTKKVLA